MEAYTGLWNYITFSHLYPANWFKIKEHYIQLEAASLYTYPQHSQLEFESRVEPRQTFFHQEKIQDGGQFQLKRSKARLAAIRAPDEASVE